MKISIQTGDVSVVIEDENGSYKSLKELAIEIVNRLKPTPWPALKETNLPPIAPGLGGSPHWPLTPPWFTNINMADGLYRPEKDITMGSRE